MIRPLHLHLQRKKKLIDISKMKMGGSKRRVSSKGLGAVLKEQRAKLYIIRRCVVMLLCWHD
ncbi:hypothetical protein ARALYDRAFT_888682 [Arabidopsis lyrata subsp. lyrata]|nr:hypothetical protein ARALYDRAFT_888682 [Arabidopsis lyrata subsp. lyrata]